MRLLDRRAVAGGGGRPAARPHPGAVHRGHAGGGPYDHGARRPGGHRDRHAAPAAPGQSRRALGAGQPGRRVPVHEDDDASRPAALPARRRYRSDRRPRCGRPGPAGRPGDDRSRVSAGASRGVGRRQRVSELALRHLPWSRASWERDADVVVVGSGAAGLTAALTAAGHGRSVLLLTKDDLGGGATPCAQGGLAAAIGPGDNPALHQRDTLDAGAGLCDPAAVATLVSEAPDEIARLAGRGARLERTALHLEGGHSRNRIVSAGGDAIGAEVHRVLLAAVAASPVQVMTRCVALDALTGDRGSVAGVLAGRTGDDGVLRVGTVTARAVILATGGFGQAYATTTNPAGLTGDGLALAARAVARAVFERDSPTGAALCRARGIDPATEPIPVAPGAHYACGGIRAGLDGRTSVTGLYAVGGAASTGVHGANRLASNSLTEALITGRRAGELLGRNLPEPSSGLRLPAAGPGVNPAVRPGLAAAMSRDAGVMRDHADLERLRQTLRQGPPPGTRAPSPRRGPAPRGGGP